MNHVALATSSIGIAATLLKGGNTVHSTFKVPTNVERKVHPVCSIPKESQLAAVIRICKLIIWDECTISHKVAFEAVDRTLKDIMNQSYHSNPAIFGGIPILVCGDFRQTIPIVPGGSIADEINASFKRSNLWTSYNVTTFRLKTNMRAIIR